MTANTSINFFLVFSTLVIMVSCEGISLTFVVDNTKSMEDDIVEIRSLVDSIMEIVSEEKGDLISNFILITFNDPDKSMVRVNSTDRTDVETALAHLSVDGGDDCAEMALSGVKLALESSLPGSFIYVFTDASAKDYKLNEDLQQLHEMKLSQIVFVVALTGVCGKPDSPEFQVYYNISTASYGMTIRVPKLDFSAVVTKFVKEDIKGYKRGIAAQLTPPDVRTEVPFLIDELTTYAIVSAAGTNVHLNHFMGTYFKTETIIWTKHSKVVKLIDPQPGNYSVSAKSINSATSVVITGGSDFYFQFGFSKRKPNSLNDTEPRPFCDILTRLSLSVTDPKNEVVIKSAQILGMDEKLIQELPLNELLLNLYTTDRFIAPCDKFKVAVVGEHAQTRKNIKRISKLPVIPQMQPPDAPEVTGVLYQEARVGSSIFIKCNVIKGVPKPELTWQFKPTNSEEFTSLNHSHNELHVSNVTGAHAGLYRCTATNSEGNDTHIIQLTVKEPAKTSDDKPLRIPCDTFSYPKPAVTWMVNGSPVIPGDKYDIEDGELIIKNPTKSDNYFSYTCTATKTFKAQVDDVSLDYSIIRNVSILQNHTLKLSCSLPRIGPSSVTWYIDDEDDGSHKPDLRIDNAQFREDGNYTCHVSNINGSASETFLVDVGYPPSFRFPQTDSTIQWWPGVTYVLRCDVIAKPPPVVEWTIDGEIVDGESSAQLSVFKWGTHICRVSNVHGAVERMFKIPCELYKTIS